MSQVKISGNASGTGVLTIAAPNTNTDRSITIPDKAGAIAVGAGTIVQVVQGTTSTQVSLSSTTFTDTTLTASITPTSSSNKILVMVCQHANAYVTSGSNGTAGIQIVRGSTTIYEALKNTSSVPYQFGSSGTGIQGYITINFLDSPSTTSSTTYKTQGAAGTQNVIFQGNDLTNAVSTITLMEIVA